MVNEEDLYRYVTGIVDARLKRVLADRFFQLTLTVVKASGLNYLCRGRRSNETTDDGNTYLCAIAGYVPAVGDRVECVWRDAATAYVLFRLSP